MKRILAGITLLSFCLAFGAGASTPEEAVKGFFDSVAAGEGEIAVTFISERLIDELTADLESITREEFAALLLSSTTIRVGITENDEIEIIDTIINGNRAVVTIRISTDNTGETREIGLVLVDEMWFIDNLGILSQNIST